MSTYWSALKNLTEEQLGFLAEGAIASTYEVVKNARTLSSVDYTYSEARKNLMSLIPAVPDSDYLRAEGLAFRLLNLVTDVQQPKAEHIADAEAILEGVRNRPPYRRQQMLLNSATVY